MSQTRLGSFIESIVNVLVGFGVGVASQYYLFPLYDIHIPFWTNVEIAVWFTFISIARSYVLRRSFNLFTVRKIALLK